MNSAILKSTLLVLAFVFLLSVPAFSASSAYSQSISNALHVPKESASTPDPLSPWIGSVNYTNNPKADLIASPSCVTYSSYIYCVGGGPATNATYYASLSASGVGKWHRSTDYPTSIVLTSCVTNSSFIYCVGGLTGSGIGITNATYYAPLSASGIGTWQSTTNYPSYISGQSCVNSGFAGTIFCIGGNTGTTTTNATYFASLSASGVGAWQRAINYPTPDIYGTSCAVNPLSQFVYCVGGIEVVHGSSEEVKSVYFAELSSGGSGNWRSTVNYPMPETALSCVYAGDIDQVIYCIGGYVYNNGFAMTNSVYYASVSLSGVSTWKSATDYPTTIAYQSCVQGGGESGGIYCVGGTIKETKIGACNPCSNAIYYAEINPPDGPAGYAVVSSLGSITGVSASMTLPTAACKSQSAYSSFSVVLDALNGEDEQVAGVFAICTSHHVAYNAGAYDSISNVFSIPSWTPAPGDKVSFSITCCTAGNFTFTLTDHTQRNSTTYSYSASGAYLNDAICGVFAAGGQTTPTTDYGTASFTKCVVTRNGHALPIGGLSSGATLIQFTMVSVPGNTMATPSALSSKENFNVAFKNIGP